MTHSPRETVGWARGIFVVCVSVKCSLTGDCAIKVSPKGWLLQARILASAVFRRDMDVGLQDGHHDQFPLVSLKKICEQDEAYGRQLYSWTMTANTSWKGLVIQNYVGKHNKHTHRQSISHSNMLYKLSYHPQWTTNHTRLAKVKVSYHG